jgi:hypothetical protein
VGYDKVRGACSGKKQRQ